MTKLPPPRPSPAPSMLLSNRRRRFQHFSTAAADSKNARPSGRHPPSVSTALLLTTFLIVVVSCCTVAAAANMDDRATGSFKNEEQRSVEIANLRRQEDSSASLLLQQQQQQHETASTYQLNHSSLITREKRENQQTSGELTLKTKDVAENGVPETPADQNQKLHNTEPLVVDLVKFQEEEEKAAQKKRRSLAAVGRRSVLVVRILDARASPPEDAERTSFITDTLLKILFQGIPGNPDYPSVKEQVYQCSAGQLELEPTPFGVLTVTVTVDAIQDREAWRQAAAQVVMEELVGTTDTTTPHMDQLRNLADHVAIVLPETYIRAADPDFRATGEIHNSLSTFSSAWAVSTSAYIHEFGHNLGLNHAARGNDIYGDTTSMMATSQGESYLPRKCYNAAQHWTLGWYDRHRVSIGLAELQQQPRRVQIAGFVHHALTDRAVLVELPGGVYMQLNLAQSYNSGVDLFPDQVTVVAKNPGGGGGTTLVGALGSASTVYRYYATQGTQQTAITVGVCRYENDVMEVSIAEGEVMADCNSAVEVRPDSNINVPVEEEAFGEVVEAPVPAPVDTTTTTTTTTTWDSLPVPAPGPDTTEQQLLSPPTLPPSREPSTDSWNSGNVDWFGKPATTFTSSAVSPLSSEPPTPVVQSASSAANPDGQSERVSLSTRDIIVGAGSAMLIVTALIVARRRRRRDLWFSALDDDKDEGDGRSFDVEVSYDDDVEASSSGRRSFWKRNGNDHPSTPTTDRDNSCSSASPSSWLSTRETIEILLGESYYR